MPNNGRYVFLNKNFGSNPLLALTGQGRLRPAMASPNQPAKMAKRGTPGQPACHQSRNRPGPEGKRNRANAHGSLLRGLALLQPSRLKSSILPSAGGLHPPDPPLSRPLASPKIRPKMAVLGPETRPGGPGLSWDSVFRPEMSKRSRPGQFRPTFGPWPKVPPAKNSNFAL